MIIKQFQKDGKIYFITCDGKHISSKSLEDMEGRRECFYTYRRKDGVFVHQYILTNG